MIDRLEIDGVHMDVGDDLKKHVMAKIGRLDKYVPRHARVSLHVDVKLKGQPKPTTKPTCEVIFHLPTEILTIHEKGENIFAAVNLAEEKLKIQLRKYKDLHAGPKLRQRLLAKLKRQTPSEM